MNQNIAVSLFAACIGTFHFGFHLAELNAPRTLIQCQNAAQSNCINMTDFDYSLITAVFAIGGLIGTLLASFLTYGRRPQLFLSAILTIVGSLILTTGSLISLLIVGRLVVGISGGLALFNTPIYINEISPLHLRGTLGTVSQIAITFGIFVASLLGYLLTEWRYIVGFPVITSWIQILALSRCYESPKYLFRASESNRDDSRSILEKFRPSGYDTIQEMDSWHQKSDTLEITFMEFLRDKVYLKLLIGIVAAHSSMQLTGINVVFFYSVSILKQLFGNQAAFYSLIISVYNILSTLISSLLIERVGRKKLLMISIVWTSASQLGLMLSLICNMPALALVFFISIVTGFSVGLCVIPFILIGELFDGISVEYANSVANPVNWISTFLVSFGFIPLTGILNEYVFLIFVAYGAISFFIMLKCIPETKGITPSDLQKRLRQ
eukprot:NODE_150_length_17275_cov_0.559618.p4 type:complete len:439 gc:universal NODE_150_length_17275_cov_0.559618:814-2130(+)